MRRRCIARYAGAFTRDHVGMSNDNAGEKPAHRKPEDSSVKLICSGIVGPQGVAYGEADGDQVNIPEPVCDAME